MQEITDILKKCTVEGNIIKLPPQQLDRKTYLEVKKSLELTGGKWKGGKTQGFVFNEDPTQYLAQLCQGEKINLKKEFQFFGTPDNLADRLVGLADIKPEHKVCEPSAGQGAIVKAINRVFPGMNVYCYELMPLNRSFLEKIKTVVLSGDNFLSNDGTKYDRIIANPPFSKNQDIDHVYEMYRCLKENGRLVSIMSNHWRFTSGKKEKEFQYFIQQTQADVYEIEEGAFKESGTNISACIVVTDKKGNIAPPQTDLNKTSKKNTNKSTKKELPPKPDDSLKQFQDSFNSFAYRFCQAEVFIDFLNYVLLVFRWWEPVRDFSYFEKKYSGLYPKFPGMLEQLSIASDNNGEGFRDALGDLFMELVSHGRNGQFFTPDNICEMMSRMIMPELQDGQTVLDPACGSARMLLAGAKRNRNASFFGCDNDITCCKMAAINLLFNTMQGEIALMDSLSMDFQKSWEISFRNINGSNMPIYRVIENKEDSLLWKLHMNSLNKEKPVVKENLTTEIPPVCNRKKEIIQLQLF